MMIRFCNVSFSYRNSEPVLSCVDLEIPNGLTLVLGPNGCGKSTLLKLAAGIEPPDYGVTEIDGHDLWTDEVSARKDLAYVPEHPDLTPYATIKEVIHLVCRLRKEPLEKGREVLNSVGLTNVANRSVRELSMGQRRRAVLAAAWIGSPGIILLDEPLESMDRAIREGILAWIDREVASGASVVIATHEIEPFVSKVTRVVTVNGGRCKVYVELPSDDEKRLAYLEALTRGL